MGFGVRGKVVLRVPMYVARGKRGGKGGGLRHAYGPGGGGSRPERG